MGTIFEKFGSNKYNKEAAVNQNFIVPLLTYFLGYSLQEIIPEENFPIFNVPVNRYKKVRSDKLPKNQRPDFVVCLESPQNPKFVVESKASSEDLEKYKPQSLAYIIGTGVNFIVLTNGNEFRIYYANDLVFEAKNIEELDLNFDILKDILSRDNHIKYFPQEIFQRINLKKSLSKTAAQENDEELTRKRLKISDFTFYLKNVRDTFQNWQVPSEFHLEDDFDFQQYPPDKLLRFQNHDPNDSSFSNIKDREIYSLSDIEEKVKSKNKIFIGNSGIGKSNLLKYLSWVKSNECLKYQNTLIPVYIQLKNFSLNNSLQSLILYSFFEKGLNISEVQFRDYLNKNEFIFLFDAYDEVQEEYIEELQHEMVQFFDICKQKSHKSIITSRNIRIPRLSLSSRFYVCPLDESQIKEFSKQYLDNDYSKFYYQIQVKGLQKESQNTLLLTLMIFIYKKYDLIPTSRTKIIEKVVENIKSWERNKPQRFRPVLSWEVKMDILSKLAFESAKKHETLSLTKEETNEIMFPIIERYEQCREIPFRVERKSLINNLISTGFIYENVDGISFWHTAFLEYFASKSLAVKYIENPAIIEEIKARLWWKFIIVGATGFLKDSTTYIESILKTNLYLASSCLLESKSVDCDLVDKIKSELTANCESSIYEVRQRGIYFLSKIEEKYPSDILFEILDKSPYSDIKQVALEQIAKSKTQRAKKIVCGFIDWKEETTFFDQTTTQSSVAKALSNFGENEHLMIIDIWKKNTDVFTCSACKEAFIDIARKNQLTEVIKEKIHEFYLKPFDQSISSDEEKRDLIKEISYEKRIDLAKVIIEIRDVNFVPKLIKCLKNINNKEKEYEFFWGAEEILASFESNDVIEQLISYAIDKNQSNILRGYCIRALSKSKGKVDFSIFKTLVEDDNLLVRGNAISGLRKYPTLQVKDILFSHINDESSWIQQEIIEILGEKGLLIELVKNNLFPIKLYNATVEAYLKQIIKYSLYNLIPTLNELRDIVKDNKRLQIQFAETYCYLSEEDKAKKIIEGFYDGDKLITDDHILHNVIKIAPNFNLPYSIELINRVLESVNILEEKYIYEDWCSEALGKIGGIDSIELLKKMVEKHGSEKHGLLIESVFRSLNPLVSTKDEDWYINFLKLHTHLSDIDLHRVIEGLGGIGTDKSIKIIRKIAQSYKDDSYILNTCFLSYEYIMSSSGKIIKFQEKDLFLEPFN